MEFVFVQIYNLDESGITTAHKPERVITEFSRKNVWGFTSGEKGKTHTIVTCTLAFRQAPTKRNIHSTCSPCADNRGWAFLAHINELAWEKDVHLKCLPSPFTTLAVFKPFF